MAGRKRRGVVLGEALRRARQAAGFSQDELAWKAKVDRTYISELENGHKSPTVDVLFRICPVLEIAVSEVIAQVEREYA
jgi:transcriptional regulator with XRE-family HTH domain